MLTNLMKDKINKKIQVIQKKQKELKNKGDLYSFQLLCNELKGINYVTELFAEYELSP